MLEAVLANLLNVAGVDHVITVDLHVSISVAVCQGDELLMSMTGLANERFLQESSR